jgi:tetratricopeptide (TPR) repeat protein
MLALLLAGVSSMANAECRGGIPGSVPECTEPAPPACDEECHQRNRDANHAAAEQRRQDAESRRIARQDTDSIRRYNEIRQRGDSALQHHQWDLARQDYSDAAAALPPHTSPPIDLQDFVNRQEFIATYNLGVEALRRGDYQQARQLFARAHELYPSDADANHALAFVDQAFDRVAQQQAEAERQAELDRQQQVAARAAAELAEAQSRAAARVDDLVAESVQALPPSGGPSLAFSAAGPGQSPVNNDAGLVDARGVLRPLPPGLPRVEEIERSPGAGAWRRGMDAFIQGHFQMAYAWFVTAQQHDPMNAALGRAVTVSGWVLGNHPEQAYPPEVARRLGLTSNNASVGDVSGAGGSGSVVDSVLPGAPFEATPPPRSGKPASASGNLAAAAAIAEARRIQHEMIIRLVQDQLAARNQTDSVAHADVERTRIVNVLMADGYSSMAIGRLAHNDYVSAERLLRRAAELDPGNTTYVVLADQVRREGGLPASGSAPSTEVTH